tara:strand:+ start:363 stop:602 length:240 start_codon:yes stop_codon:yes gene_type:complete
MKKLNYAATIAYLGAVILTGGLVFLGHSNHKLSESNDELSGNLEELIEAYLTSDKDCYLLAPKPDDYIIWEEMPYKEMI